MSRYIKPNSLSVGYNNGGQGFFDVLNSYREYIHSYFFSFDYMYESKLLNQKKYKDVFRKCNTFDIPANVLINNYEISDNWRHIIEDALSYDINLTSVTVVSPEIASNIRKYYPQLEIHSSVRVIDRYVFNPYKIFEIFDGLVDVINMSVAHQHHDIKFQEKCKSKNIKTKFILNETCLLGMQYNYKNFEGFNNETCTHNNVTSSCQKMCENVVNKYPWLDISRTRLYKESLPYMNHDIYKLATRLNYIYNRGIANILDYWTSDNPTRFIGVKRLISINDKNRKTFEDYIKFRNECSCDCNTCRKCEYFYNKLIDN